MNCSHTEHAVRGDGRYGRFFNDRYDQEGSWEKCGMNESEAHLLLSLVTSKNFNKEGIAMEWHPLALDASRDFEADVLEIGFIPAYFMYDENVWGEGALSHVTDGTNSRG